MYPPRVHTGDSPACIPGYIQGNSLKWVYIQYTRVTVPLMCTASGIQIRVYFITKYMNFALMYIALIYIYIYFYILILYSKAVGLQTNLLTNWCDRTVTTRS